jgi:hydrogenase nickel incorporation protein HypA/HybF
MHELGLAEDVLRKIKDEAKKKQSTKVSWAIVEIGETLITDPPEFKELFATIALGTVAEGAQLELEIKPLRAECATCQKGFDPKALRFDCPHCGSTDIRVVAGREIIVRDLR